MTKQDKIQFLTDVEGYDSPEDMVSDYITESLVPAICVNEDCDFTEFMEPDQNEGYCEHCEENTVQSCMVLLGII